MIQRPPAQRIPISERGGATNPWYAWFSELTRNVQEGVTEAQLSAATAAIATALGSPDGTIAGIPASADAGAVIGRDSIKSLGLLRDGRVTLMLIGDTAAPGNTYVYGTTATGEKGWQPVSDALAQGDGLTLTVGDDGVTTFALAELADTGIGAALVKTTRDAYGRVEGTEAATTDDLTEGANLYFTDERAAAAAPIQSIVAGTNVTVDATDPQNPIVSASGGGSASLPPGYIDGLQMVWVSGTALTVTSGSAYIESDGVLQSPTAIAKAGLSLTASTWHHVYLFDNAGTPDIEIVTTAPASPYNGSARSKTGDSSRRYLGSVLVTGASNIAAFRHSNSRIDYLTATSAAPFRVLSNGMVFSAETTVSASAAVPITSTNADVRIVSQHDSVATFGTPDDTISLSGTAFLLRVPPNSEAYPSLQLSASQQFTYYLNGSSGGLYVDIRGYDFER